MNIQVIILAAGKGSRMRSTLPKVLHQIAGKALVQHVIDSCYLMGATHCHLVVGHGSEQVKKSVSSEHVELIFVEQSDQLGTGHAVKVALDGLKANTPTLILYGDVPLTHHDTLSQLVEMHQKIPSGIVLMTCFLDDPTGYGRIIRDADSEVMGIVEHKDASKEQKSINEVNTGILCCNSDQLRDWVEQLDNNNVQGEFYLTDIIAMAVNAGEKVVATQPAQLYEVEGVNTLRQLAELERVWQLKMAQSLMDEGVTFRDPTRFDLRGDLSCEADVVIDVNCVFEGQVVIKQGANIGPNCCLKNCTIGKNVIVKASSVIEESVLDEDSTVGPFARLRPGTHLRKNAQVGNFVEIKKSVIGEGSKAGHLTYIGDAEIGKGVNIGAGTITCNYDGANKHKTIIENGAFIGSDTQLVAPIRIGKNATVGAGTTVTTNVSDNSLCISRVKQKQIHGWVKSTQQK